MRLWVAAFVLVFVGLTRALPVGAEVASAPDILILGDSQLTFGAGEAFVELFDQIAGQCGLDPDMTTGVIGVRSSTLVSWTGKSKSAKGPICDIDPKWKVNAGAYGSLSPGENPFVQIGRGPQFQFCKAKQSPLEAVFQMGDYNPRLVLMFLMGNATERWADSPAAALQDARAFVTNLPQGQPCIFMTTAPPYREKVVRQREQAQKNIEDAFASLGGRCSFVAGFTAETIAENLGNAVNFRRDASGAVKDSYHPTKAAARQFLRLQRGALCQAITAQLAR